MLEVSEVIKRLYRTGADSKKMILTFPALNLTIQNANIVSESMQITESICENEELTFGDCNSAEFKITVADIEQDLNEQTFTVAQVLNNDNTLTMPLGTYTVKSCKRQANRWFKDIVAYDSMIKLDRDVTAWYNSRTFPVTLKSLRESLLVYCDIPFEQQDLPNDSILINKTIRPSSMNGRDVMKRICELNGGFGHITRQNKFKVITLAGLGLYPSETLYPSEDLFPAESGEIMDGSEGSAGYLPESTYEDYISRAIDQLRIQTGENDSGIVVNNGTAGTNEYIIQGNFLISDKSTAELTDIANSLFLIIRNKYYRPHNMVTVGLPYLEVGDSILIDTKNDAIESFIFSRTLSGIQALKDSLSATGYEYRKNKVGLDVQISQLEQTTSVQQDNIENMQEDIEDIQEFNGETLVRLQSLGDSIEAEVTRATGAEGTLSTQISVTAAGLNSKVSYGEVVSEINQSAEAIVLRANRLIVDSTDFTLDGSGNATFKGDIEVSGVDGNGTTYSVEISPNIADISSYITESGGKYYESFLNATRLIFRKNGKRIIEINGSNGVILLNGYSVITGQNIHNFVPSSTSDITWDDNGNGNAIFAGTSLRGASTSWVLDNFERKSSSDVRLKKEILSADDKIVDFLKRLKVKTYRFKDGTEDNKIHAGVLAQEVMTAMETAGMDWTEYDVVEEYDTRPYKDEGMYTKGGKAYRVNYRELSNMLLYGWQEQQKEIDSLKSELSDLKQLLIDKGVI